MKYVYCVTRANAPAGFGAIGIGTEPARVWALAHRDIAAIVSDAPEPPYQATRDNVLAHERVIETVMRRYTVVPMSFGTLFERDEDVVELLASAHDAFGDVLEKMENKLELGLKVLWDPEVVAQEIERSDERVHALSAEIESQQGSTYFARTRYGQLMEALLRERSDRTKSEIFGALRELSLAARVSEPIGDRMILNAAFLITREQEPRFDARVMQLGAQHAGLTFKYTGPWPPYSFVNIGLKLPCPGGRP